MNEPTVVIGIGHPYRRDDAVGLVVLDLLAEHTTDLHLIPCGGEATELIAAWEGTGAAILVDALHHHDAQPGRVHRVDIDTDAPGPHEPKATSSHGVDLGQTLALARALDRRPAHLTVYAIEVADVAYGVGLSPPVAAAARSVAERIRTADRPA
jgi:hydrogenase maturation protease